MDLFLHNGEPLPEGIRRIAVGHLQENIALLSQLENQHEAIHEARKNFKKLRAIIRLIRYDIGHAEYHQENLIFRDAARKLSGLRDIAAMLETLARIAERYPQKPTLLITQKVSMAFFHKKDAAEQKLMTSGNVMETVKISILPSLKRMAHIPLGKDSFSNIFPGLKRVYKEGYRGLKVCLENPTAENLHHWRKRVKYLWYQMLILANIWPALFLPFAEELHILSELLGIDHDLAVLLTELDSNEILPGRVTGKTHLVRLIHQYRKELLEDILPLGKKIYLLPPLEFTVNIQEIWTIWREQYPIQVGTLSK